MLLQSNTDYTSQHASKCSCNIIISFLLSFLMTCYSWVIEVNFKWFQNYCNCLCMDNMKVFPVLPFFLPADLLSGKVPQKVYDTCG